MKKRKMTAEIKARVPTAWKAKIEQRAKKKMVSVSDVVREVVGAAVAQ